METKAKINEERENIKMTFNINDYMINTLLN